MKKGGGSGISEYLTAGQSFVVSPFSECSSVQWLYCVLLFATLWTAAHHHEFPKLVRTHVHQVSDAIQPSHPLSSPSPPAFYISQHLGLFQCVGPSHQVAKVLELQL